MIEAVSLSGSIKDEGFQLVSCKNACKMIWIYWTITKCMGYVRQKWYGLWDMAMGINLAGNSLCSSLNLWLIRVYGLSEVWLRRVSTVVAQHMFA